MSPDRKILVLGGYGNFGRLVAQNLSARDDVELVIAGRNRNKATGYCNSLRESGAACTLSSAIIDINAADFPYQLAQINPCLVIHTSGPFQGQDYRVAEACIATGSHYIDLADDRRFVCDFSTLDSRASQKNTIAITGASSVPGLSSVIIDKFSTEFRQIDEIDYCIIPGSKVNIGEATIGAILSYTGVPFDGWEEQNTRKRYGCLDTRRYDFGGILGKRWLSNINIPDLELFPVRYQGVKSVRFQAGHELPPAHLILSGMAVLKKLNLAGNWRKLTHPIYKLGSLLRCFGTNTGGMVINLSGLNNSGQKFQIIWRLIAPNGVGPNIPTIPAIILANNILDGSLAIPKAAPCLGMFKLEEFSAIADKWGIYQEVERKIG